MPDIEPSVPPNELAEIKAELQSIQHLIKKFERRDKWRTFWGSVGGIVRLIPILFTLYFAYYFYTNGEQIMQDIFKKSFSMSTNMFMGSGNDNNAIEGDDPDLTDKIKTFFGN